MHQAHAGRYNIVRTPWRDLVFDASCDIHRYMVINPAGYLLRDEHSLIVGGMRDFSHDIIRGGITPSLYLMAFSPRAKETEDARRCELHVQPTDAKDPMPNS